MQVSKDDIRLFLYKPNKEPLGEIRTFLSPKHIRRLGQVNELTFTLPCYTNKFSFVEVGKPFELMQIENPFFKILRERYLLKVVVNNKSEWYLIDRINKTGAVSGNYKEVKAFSRQYELRGDNMFDWSGVWVDGEYRTESLTIEQITNNVLESTLWKIDYVDPELFGIYRGFEFNDNTTKLEAIYEIANTFGAIVIFDTENRTLSYYKKENYGRNDGLSISHRRYLKTIQDEVKPSDVVTQLVPVGKDGLRINSKNPTGTPYLQDFSFWMQPFERDEEGNVLQSSYWLSDELCNALIDYNILVEQKQEDFDSLISIREDLLTQYGIKQAEISDKNSEIRQVTDIIDFKQTAQPQQDASEELAQLEALQNELSELQLELNEIENNLDANQSNLNNITEELNFESNLTFEQIEEITPFFNKAVWTNENLTNIDDLLEGSKEYFKEVNRPQKAINISIVDLFRVIEGKKDVSKLNLGDKINIHYEYLDINVESQIIEMDIDYDSGAINLVIANTKDVFVDDDERTIASLYENVSVAGAALREKYKWDKITEVESTVNNYINSALDAAKQEIKAGVNQSVLINNRGITTTDSSDPNKFIRITNSTIGLTRDGGNTLGVAITADGVVAERLYGRIIAGVNLVIENESGNYVIDNDGFALTRTDGKARIFLNPESGIKTQKKEGTDWIDQLFLDIDGNAVFRGEVNSDDGQGNKVILDNGSIRTYKENKLMINLSNYNLDFYDAPINNPSGNNEQVGGIASGWNSDNFSERGLNITGNKDYVSISRSISPTSNRRWALFNFTDGRTIIAGGDNDKSEGRISLRSLWASGKPRININRHVSNGTDWSGILHYAGQRGVTPKDRYSHEFWIYDGWGSGSDKQALKINNSKAEFRIPITPYYGIDEEGWTDLSLYTAWSNYGGSYQTAQYRVDPFGYVHLRGLIQGGIAGYTIASFIGGVEPAQHQGFHCASSLAGGTRVYIRNNGELTCETDPGSFLFLDGISWRMKNWESLREW